MLKFFCSYPWRHRWRGDKTTKPVADPADPLSHPALKGMSPAELADLPLPRH